MGEKNNSPSHSLLLMFLSVYTSSFFFFAVPLYQNFFYYFFVSSSFLYLCVTWFVPHDSLATIISNLRVFLRYFSLTISFSILRTSLILYISSSSFFFVSLTVLLSSFNTNNVFQGQITNHNELETSQKKEKNESKDEQKKKKL